MPFLSIFGVQYIPYVRTSPCDMNSVGELCCTKIWMLQWISVVQNWWVEWWNMNLSYNVSTLAHQNEEHMGLKWVNAVELDPCVSLSLTKCMRSFASGLLVLGSLWGIWPSSFSPEAPVPPTSDRRWHRHLSQNWRKCDWAWCSPALQYGLT